MKSGKVLSVTEEIKKSAQTGNDSLSFEIYLK